MLEVSSIVVVDEHVPLGLRGYPERLSRPVLDLLPGCQRLRIYVDRLARHVPIQDLSDNRFHRGSCPSTFAHALEPNVHVSRPHIYPLDVAKGYVCPTSRKSQRSWTRIVKAAIALGAVPGLRDQCVGGTLVSGIIRCYTSLPDVTSLASILDIHL